MPSVANCNVPNKSRRKAQRTKTQKQRASAGIKKNARGTATSSVIHPTSGPLAPLSGKKARKVEKARMHALKRQAEKEGLSVEEFLGALEGRAEGESVMEGTLRLLSENL